MVKYFTRITNVFLSSLLLVVLFSGGATAQISINPFTKSYTQNFDGLPSSGTGTWEHDTSYFPGWYLFRTVPVTTTITAGAGTGIAGGMYSYGSSGSTDRALGSIASANKLVGEFAWGLMIQNNTGSTITSLNISFTGEQWRSASPSAPQHMLSFWYATGASPAAFNLSPKSDAGWTNVKELNFLGPVFYTSGGALNGNDPANKRYLSASIPVIIPDKGYVMLRWKDLDEFENDHGLAIDDFSMTWSTEAGGGPGILPVELMSFRATAQHNAVHLNWVTASEKNNKHFIVERSANGKEFTGVATITGKGNSATRSNYSYSDDSPLAGTSYYRLKQVDEDDTYSYSAIVAVKVRSSNRAVLYPSITSENLFVDVPESYHFLSIFDLSGKQLYKQQLPSHTRSHSVNVSKLNAGSYSLHVVSEKGEKQVLRFVKR